MNPRPPSDNQPPPPPPSPREELEARLTALALGEAGAFEAETLRTRIAADPDLAALYRRIEAAALAYKNTFEDQRASANLPPLETAPEHLSADRAARLAQLFATDPVVASPTVHQPAETPHEDRARKILPFPIWAQAMAAVACLILVAAIFIPTIGGALSTSKRLAASRSDVSEMRELAVHAKKDELPHLYQTAEAGLAENRYQEVADNLASSSNNNPGSHSASVGQILSASDLALSVSSSNSNSPQVSDVASIQSIELRNDPTDINDYFKGNSLSAAAPAAAVAPQSAAFAVSEMSLTPSSAPALPPPPPPAAAAAIPVRGLDTGGGGGIGFGGAPASGSSPGVGRGGQAGGANLAGGGRGGRGGRGAGGVAPGAAAPASMSTILPPVPPAVASYANQGVIINAGPPGQLPTQQAAESFGLDASINNGNLRFADNRGTIFSGVISGTGNVTLNSPIGTGSANSLNAIDNLDLRGGSLSYNFGGDAALRPGNGPAVAGGQADGASTRAANSFNDSDSLALNLGQTTLTKVGTGNLTLAGKSTYTGNSVVIITGNATITGGAGALNNDAPTYRSYSDTDIRAVNLSQPPAAGVANANSNNGIITGQAGALVLGSSQALQNTTFGGLSGGKDNGVNNNNRSSDVTFAIGSSIGSYGGSVDQFDSARRIQGSTNPGAVAVKEGGGNLTMTGINSYSGSTQLSSGSLTLATGSTLEDVTGTETPFTVGGTTYVGNVTGAGSLTKLGTSTATESESHAIGDMFDTNGNDVTLGTAFSGTGGLVKIGTAGRTTTDSESFTGGFTISAGTLSLGSNNVSTTHSDNQALNQTFVDANVSGGMGSATVQLGRTILNGGSVAVAANTLTIGGNITNVGAITKAGAGTLTLNSNNTYTGATVVQGGIVVSNDKANGNFGMGNTSLLGGLQWAANSTTDVSQQLNRPALQPAQQMAAAAPLPVVDAKSRDIQQQIAREKQVAANPFESIPSGGKAESMARDIAEISVSDIADKKNRSVLESPEYNKLNTIFIPEINIDRPMPLDQVIKILHDLSVKYDPDGKGVDFHTFAPSGDSPMPKVTLAGLKGLSLAALLKIACFDAKPTYSYNAEGSIVTLREADQPTARPPSEVKFPAPVETAENAFSTFSLNVSDAAYQLARAALLNHRWPDPASTRTEEFLNAFHYHDPAPATGEACAFNYDLGQNPVESGDLLRVSFQTAAAGRDRTTPLRLTILLDDSGSMTRADRAATVQAALRALGSLLRAGDTVSLVTFARTPQVRVTALPAERFAEILALATSIEPEGGTNMEEALRTAYATARSTFAEHAQNRVILLTDGAANLGELDPAALAGIVEENRKAGIALDAYGVGWDGYDDTTLEALTRKSDGRYAFLNGPADVNAAFATKLAGALAPAANDVKLQIEFNPKRVTSYRLMGYNNLRMTKEQFRDNTVNAGELAAADQGTALYNLAIDPAGAGPIGTARARYRDPGTTNYHEVSWTIQYNGLPKAFDQAAPALRLAAVAGYFAEYLQQSPYAGGTTPRALLNLLHGVPEAFAPDARPAELAETLTAAATLAGN